MHLSRIEDACGYDHVYLSPHLDDAALSCGAAIAMLRARGQRVLVLTLCTAVPESQRCATSTPSSPWDVPTRRCEDERAMAILDCDFVWAELLDAPFRHRAYAKPQGPFCEPCADDSLPEATKAILAALGSRVPEATLHAPLGIGLHVDHLAACDAARATSAFTRRALYEDFPYVLKSHGLLDQRRAALGPLTATCHDIGTWLPRKIEAIEAYASQIDLLFGPRAAIRSAVERCARTRGTDGLCEREWSTPE